MTQADWVFEVFSSLEESLNGGRSSAFHQVRRDALSKFVKAGFPTPQVEDWKYTNINKISKGAFALAKPTPSDSHTIETFKQELAKRNFSSHRLVFIDGFFNESLSSINDLPHGVRVAGLRTILDGHEHPLAELVYRYLGKIGDPDGSAFSNLNTAFSRDGAFIEIGKNVRVSQPLQICFLTTSGAQLISTPRVLVYAGSGCEVQCIEMHVSQSNAPYFSNALTEVLVEDQAKLTYYTLQQEGENASRVGSLHARVKSGGRFESWLYSFGGNLVRNEIYPILEGQGAEIVLNGLTVNDKQQHTDNHTSIDHAEPHCQSTELYKGIYAGNASGVFSGTIIVRQHAQKTNAIQSNQSLLLSDTAKIDSRPQLKIWADDVKCTHGATVGRLDSNALFYLRSRGIGEKEARDILIHAFASDVISGVAVPALQEYLEGTLMKKLQGMREPGDTKGSQLTGN